MTHTEVRRDLRSVGNLSAETVEIDISALDSAGTETGVSPDAIDRVEFVAAHVKNGTGQRVSWDETNDELELTDGSGAEVANDATVNGVQVTFVGRR
jgi:hypothetical protein